MKNIKIAYVILCHRNPKQVNFLIERLDDECVDFFIHIDKKSPIQPDILQLDNVHFINNPINVIWGDYSQIECILRSFSEIKKHGNYDYINVISGQDIPLVPNNIIINFFKKNIGKEFVGYIEMTSKKENKELYKRLCVYYPKFLISKSKGRSFIRNIYTRLIMAIPFLQRDLKALPSKLYKGSNWLSITGDCMEYILNYIKNNPAYVDFFKHTFCADEIFFQTIILNSKFKENVVNSYKRYVDWTTGPDYPRTLTLEDFDHIIQNEGKQFFWGRKFDLNNNDIAKIIRKIEDISTCDDNIH